MATTAWSAMRPELVRFLGYSELVGLNGGAWTTTTNIASSALLVSTELRDAGFDDIGEAGSGDYFLEGLWTLVLGTNNDRVVRKVKSYDASSGTITATGTNFSSESGSRDFELHRFHPLMLRDKANDARLSMFPILHVPVSRYLSTARSQVRYDVPAAIKRSPDAIYLYKGISVSHGNNILSNGDFETFTGGVPDSWAATTLDTAQESTTTSPFNYATIDGSAVRCTSRNGSTGTLLQTIASSSTHSGQRITLQVWVHCRTASIVSTQITINGTINLGTNVDGGLHRGTGWELLTHFEDAPVTIASLTVGISVLSSATDNTEFYLDSAVCVVGPNRAPEVAPTKLRNWTYREDNQGGTVRQYVQFTDEFPDNRLLRFEGKDYLSEVTAEADAMEIAKPQSDLLYARVAEELYQEYGPWTPDMDEAHMISRLRNASRRMETLMIHASPHTRPALTLWS